MILHEMSEVHHEWVFKLAINLIIANWIYNVFQFEEIQKNNKNRKLNFKVVLLDLNDQII